MKKNIIPVLVIVLIGVVIGLIVRDGSSSEPVVAVKENKAVNQAQEYTPTPIDFVSTRPEVVSLPVEVLSASEKSGLLYMREEEKLARDVYTTLYEKWGLQIFVNIAQSEQTHTEAVRDLLVKYDIPDPVTDDTIGVFSDTSLQALYDSLVVQGSVSEIEALKVGALIEDLDIFDLQKNLAEVDNADITLVYSNLERGSKNHLRAFVRQLDLRGGEYQAQYIDAAEYTEIISTDSSAARGVGGQNTDAGKGCRGWGKSQ